MHPRSPPWKRVIACQGNVRPVALKTSDHAPEDSAKHADAPQARLPRLRIGIFRGSSSICLFCLGKRGTMQSRSSLIGVNVTSNPDLRDSCWTSTIRKYRRIHAAPRIGPMKSASIQRSRQLEFSTVAIRPQRLLIAICRDGRKSFNYPSKNIQFKRKELAPALPIISPFCAQ